MTPLLCAALVVLLEGLSVASLFPVTHAYCGELGGDAAATGLLFALVSAPKIVLNPLWGRLSDRIGRRPVLVIVTAGTLLGSIGWALAPNLLALAASRAVVGVFGAQAVIAFAIASDVTPAARRASAMGMLGAAFATALTFGPAIGGIVGAYASPAAVGWLAGAFQCLSLALIAAFLPESRPEPNASEPTRAISWIGEMLAPLSARGAAGLLVVSALMTAALSLLTAALGEYAAARFSLGSATVGGVFASCGFAMALTQGGVARVASKRLGDRLSAIVGLMVVTGGFGAIALRLPLAAWIGGVLALSVGVSLATPCVTALISRCVGAAEQGLMHGLNQAAIGLGRTLGFVAAGLLFAGVGPEAPFAAAAIVSAVACVVLWSRVTDGAPGSVARDQ